MSIRSSPRLALVAAALLVPAMAQAGRCRPVIGHSAAQVIHSCGKPDAVTSTRSITGWRVEEWRYGDVYVGLIEGRVNYILK